MTNSIQASSVVEGESLTVRAKMQDQDTLEALVQADIDEIYLQVFDLGTGERCFQGTLEIGEHFSNTPLTTGWDGLGWYNFFDSQPTDYWQIAPQGGHTYRLQYEFRLMDARLIRRSIVLPVEEWQDG